MVYLHRLHLRCMLLFGTLSLISGYYNNNYYNSTSCDYCDNALADYIVNECCDKDTNRTQYYWGPCNELEHIVQDCIASGQCYNTDDPCDTFSPRPSTSASPSSAPTISDQPTVTASSVPSSMPSSSVEPTLSASPTSECTCPNCTHSSGCNPDPHYYAWDNSYYDFQGGCDQIAIDNPILQMQMRTRPRNYWSTVTEVVVLMKATGQTVRVGAYGNSNNIDGASNAQVDPLGSNGYQLNFLQAPGSYIRMTNYGTNVNIQVQGSGAVFCSSEGMFGSWNYGGVRFRSGALYDTSGGWAVTRTTSIALALDWKVPLADSLLTNPSDICDGSSNCGTGEIFSCGAFRERRELQDVGECTSTCDDIVDPTGILQSACEEDLLLLNGDNFFTCQPSYQEPTILVADPDDFDNNNAPCSDAASDEVEEVIATITGNSGIGWGFGKAGNSEGNKGNRKRMRPSKGAGFPPPGLNRGCPRVRVLELCDRDELKYLCPVTCNLCD